LYENFDKMNFKNSKYKDIIIYIKSKLWLEIYKRGLN
jgi:hypothetical protein